MTRLPFKIMRRAMLPLDGSIAEQMPAILSTYARIVPVRDWRRLTVVDFTAGSCLLPLLFAARGVDRLVVNDIAARTQLAAEALFGRCLLNARRVRQLLMTKTASHSPHVPSFHFTSDYLTEEVAGTFDRLFYGRLPDAERPAYRYLALRWVLGFAHSADLDFEVLPTHDHGQLRNEMEHDWRPYIRRVQRKHSIIATLVADINSAIGRVAARRIELRGDDMRTCCGDIEYGRRNFVAINPPTRGLDEYVADDQIAHSLLANRLLPLSRSRETAEQFWTSCVETALGHLPRGSHALAWGGDGAMSWRQCWRVWTRHAAPLVVRRVGRGHRAAGWTILEKR